ncbi:uncharacterized protein LOC134727117 [Mytilus trossulus]|uniref:uncharacterized protein LOC134727117 n=1 Tax=Mytilus trossulus TaxID=6551 RepID=UPI00300711D2
MYTKRQHIDDSDDPKMRCVALLIKSADQSSFYQYRNCSDFLPILCKEGSNLNNDSLFPANSTESAFGSTSEPSSAAKGKIVIVNFVLVGLCIFVIMLIILRKQVNMQNCQTANQKSRSNTINKQPKAHRDRNSVRDNEDENRAARYNESWELRHNIVQLGQLDQQGIINVQLEETET